LEGSCQLYILDFNIGDQKGIKCVSLKALSPPPPAAVVVEVVYLTTLFGDSVYVTSNEGVLSE
jgi:hypothetical protein